jgi:fatty-acyl-CoA synthase
MTNRAVGSWIERRARMSPARIALIFGEHSWTYTELAARIRRLANGLESLGVKRADRIAWIGPNHPAFLEALFAAGTLGAAVAPINHRLDEMAIVRLIDEVDPTVVILHRSMAHLTVPDTTRVVVGEGAMVGGDVDYDALVESSSDAQMGKEVTLEDLCLLPFTSGTTGASKGVMLTHGNITWNVVNFLSSADFRSDDVTVAIAPFFRVGGTGVNVLPVLFKGGTVVVPTSLDPEEILRLVPRHGVTIGFGNPDLLDAMTRSPLWRIADLSSIRYVMIGGAPVPERLIRTFLDRGIILLQGYGLSEAAPLVLLVDPEDAIRKVGAAGRPPLFVDVRIVRPDLVDVAPGETGELLVRGPNVMAGYWKRPDATRAAIDERGWLKTGDAAWADPEGDIWIVDRVHEGYPTAGGVVYPGNVERVLVSDPAVLDAGVVGVPSAGGYVGAAFVMLAPGSTTSEADLLALCRQRLANHEVPASITFVDALPRSSVGKLLRQMLKTLAD